VEDTPAEAIDAYLLILLILLDSNRTPLER
jgi:hypothetical protein